MSLRCDRIANAVSLATPALPAVAGPTAMTIRTTSLVRALAAAPSGADTVASLEPRDALLDAIAFSRGRFIVEQRGAATLAVPAWAEVGRVIEDCRR